MCVDRKMRTTNNYKIIKRRKLYTIDERTSAVDGNTDDVFVFLLKELYVMKQFVRKFSILLAVFFVCIVCCLIVTPTFCRSETNRSAGADIEADYAQ